MPSALDIALAYYDEMTPENIGRLREIARPDIHFVDPFNDVTGIDRMIAVFDRMYHDLTEIQWVIQGHAQVGLSAYLRWRFTAQPKGGGKLLSFEGMTELRFDDQGKLAAHLDFWDPTGPVYERVPILAWVLRFIRRKLGEG